MNIPKNEIGNPAATQNASRALRNRAKNMTYCHIIRKKASITMRLFIASSVVLHNYNAIKEDFKDIVEVTAEAAGAGPTEIVGKNENHIGS